MINVYGIAAETFSEKATTKILQSISNEKFFCHDYFKLKY